MDTSGPIALSEQGSLTYLSLAPNLKIIDEAIWMSSYHDEALSATHVLASTITKGLMMNYYSFYHETGSLPADSQMFHNRAELLMRAASPRGFSLWWRLARNQRAYDAIFRRRCGRFRTYRGCVMLLAADLSTSTRVEANVVRAIQYAKMKGKEDCTFILCSIQHVAVAEISGAVSGNLRVSHSRAYPFFGAYDPTKENADESAFALLAYYLRPHCIDEAILKPNTANALPLPYDIIQQIMGFVEVETYDAFSLACKALRRQWFLHPRINDYTTLAGKRMKQTIDVVIPRSVFRATLPNGYRTSLRTFGEKPCVYIPPESDDDSWNGRHGHRFVFDDDDDDDDLLDEGDSVFDDESYDDDYGNLRSSPGHYAGWDCCPCQNPCPGKKCRFAVGLRMPPRDKETIRRAACGTWGPHRQFYFGDMFTPRLLIMDIGAACRRCTRSLETY